MVHSISHYNLEIFYFRNHQQILWHIDHGMSLDQKYFLYNEHHRHLIAPQ